MHTRALQVEQRPHILAKETSKRALYTFKRALFTRERALYIFLFWRLPWACAASCPRQAPKEPDVSVTEPCIPAEEPYKSANKLCASANKLCASAIDPCTRNGKGDETLLPTAFDAYICIYIYI